MEDQKNNENKSNTPPVIFLPSGYEKIKIEDNSLKKAIIKTMAFFDIFNYPLTSWEVYKFLYNNNSKYFEVEMVLQELEAENRISSKNGFYYFLNREDILEIRQKNYNFADKKYKLALWSTRWLRILSGVKMVGVCNNLAYSNADEKSDIDVFIITEKERIWTTRFLITIIAQLLGVRRYSHHITDKICLSFYITKDNLNLENIKLESDPYFYYWLATMSPIYNNGVYDNFWASNSWLKDFLPNIFRKNLCHRRRVDFKKSLKIDKILLKDEIGEFLEAKTKIVQFAKMNHNTNSVAQEDDSRVIINDKMLKFHEQDRREEYKDKWLKRILWTS